MLKCVKLDSIPDGLDIKYEEVNTEIGIQFLVGPEFKDTFQRIENGNVWVQVEVPEEYKDETDIFKLVEVSSEIRAYVFTGGSPMVEDKVVLDTSVRLKAPIAVTFKLPTLPEKFHGNLHKFQDRISMRRAMKDDYIDFDRIPNSIELGVYYVCLVLCEDYQGPLDYEYFINNLKYDKLTAYYIEAEKLAGQKKGKELTFRYKNNHYDS